MTDSLEKFTGDNLKPLIGQNFTIKDCDNNSVAVVLSEVDEQELKGIEGTCLSAIFTNEEGAVVDGRFVFEHEAIGACSLTISQNSATEFEVIVSRLKHPVTPPQDPD